MHLKENDMVAVNSNATSTRSLPLAKIRQWIKLTVYSLLLLNFAYYIHDDWTIAQHTLNETSTLLDWSSAFAASIDELAWFVLLFLFELETYVLPDESFTRARVALMHSVRAICYLFLAHTLFAYGTTNVDLNSAVQLREINSLCELVGEDISFGYNLEYTELDSKNCASLSSGQTFYLIDEGLVVTDSYGLVIEKQLARLDLVEASTWLLILLIIEIMVRMQERNITRSRMMSALKVLKVMLYGLLWGAAAYWIYRGHYIYAWDETLWILGFMAIGMNLSEWRKEIEDEAIDRQTA